MKSSDENPTNDEHFSSKFLDITHIFELTSQIEQVMLNSIKMSLLPHLVKKFNDPNITIELLTSYVDDWTIDENRPAAAKSTLSSKSSTGSGGSSIPTKTTKTTEKKAAGTKTAAVSSPKPFDDNNSSESITEDSLSKLTVNELRNQCKSLNLSMSGIKATLVNRICKKLGIAVTQEPQIPPTTTKQKAAAHTISDNSDDSDDDDDRKKKKPVKPSTSTVKKPTKKKKITEKVPAVVEKLKKETELQNNVVFEKDEFDNIIWKDPKLNTSFVFNADKEAIGYIENGVIRALERKHYDRCKSMGFLYTIPHGQDFEVDTDFDVDDTDNDNNAD